MYDRMKTYTDSKPRTRKIVGWFFVVVGFIALVTPLTPGGFLFFVGLELLGIRFIGAEKIRNFFTRKKSLPALKSVALDIPEGSAS